MACWCEVDEIDLRRTVKVLSSVTISFHIQNRLFQGSLGKVLVMPHPWLVGS